MMKRNFLPVGQGAFYCESHEVDDNERINIVYDCGSSSDIFYVKREIKNYFKKGETVHAVFISHLHKDHINGLPFLLKHCNVKNIYFPLIEEQYKELMKLYNLVNGVSGFANNFLYNPRRAINELGVGEGITLIGVKEFDEEVQDYSIEVNSLLNSGEIVTDEIIKGSLHNNILDEWLYIPHNFRQDSRIQQLQDALKEEFYGDMSNDKFLDKWKSGNKKDRKKIREAYKKVPGDFNTNSMTLFSGEKTMRLRQYLERRSVWGNLNRHNYYKHNSGCLYTGDYDALGAQKWQSLLKAYNTYWNHIGCIQIPHHGSRHNFNNLLLVNNAYCIISAGMNNSYGHPHESVFHNINMNGNPMCIVTEDLCTTTRFEVR